MKDCPEIHDLQVKSFQPLLDKYQDYATNPAAEPVERVAQRLERDNTDYYFIRLGEKNIGFVSIVRLGDGLCRISPICVLPDHQGKGCAQQAMRQAEAMYPQAKHWELDTIKEEAALCYLYEKLGYRLTGEEKTIKDGMTIVHYAKQSQNGGRLMQVVFIRHCEPDYSHVTERGFIGHGLDMAQLTKKGKEQALAVASDKRLEGIELILSSPYTRALETASIVSRHLDTEIKVETDLHEWLPDLSHAFSSIAEKGELFQLFAKNKGRCPQDSPVRYEEYQSMFDRVNTCLQKYLSCKKIAVVTHGLVISAFCYPAQTPWGGIVEFEFANDLTWKGWVG